MDSIPMLMKFVRDESQARDHTAQGEAFISATHMINETKLERLSENYLAALRIHSKNGEQAGLKKADKLGLRAVALGLETLDLAKIHEKAIATLALAGNVASPGEKNTSHAETFFARVLAPIEKTNLLARQADAELINLNASLAERTEEVEASERKLQQDIFLRETAESTLESSHVESKRLLEESRHLQEHLQEMAHLILTAQEEERKTMSHSLQDDIAQTLLGIQVRLVALKKEAAVNNKDFKKEIATTRRLVEKSVKTINLFARELGIPHAN